MSPSARREYVARMKEVYRNAKKRVEKSRVLDQVSETLRRGRRTAKRLMSKPLGDSAGRRRKPVYPMRIIDVLGAVWEASQYAWSVRLKALLPLWMPRIKERFRLSAAEQKMVLRISPATMDRRLAPRRRALGRRLYGQTKPGRWLRQSIPIKTDSSGVTEPGWMETDTVSHSGPDASGLFAYTLDHTDLSSGWTELRAMLGKASVQVVAKTDEIRKELPFEMKGLDSDGGEEFINYDLVHYCRRTGVKQFRSRPYKKNDQAHVEQKNGTHVRRLIGWHRYDTQEAVDAMNDLYRNEWRLLSNLFLPSVKLDYKIRRGSKIKRIYRKPMTPLDRLWESQQGDRAKLEALRELRTSLDPFELAKVVDRKLQAVWKQASNGRIRPAPTPYVPGKARPWEAWKKDNDARLAQLPRHPDRDMMRAARTRWRDGYFGTN